MYIQSKRNKLVLLFNKLVLVEEKLLSCYTYMDMMLEILKQK